MAGGVQDRRDEDEQVHHVRDNHQLRANPQGYNRRIAEEEELIWLLVGRRKESVVAFKRLGIHISRVLLGRQLPVRASVHCGTEFTGA